MKDVRINDGLMPVIYLGPSLSLESAKRTLSKADYRPPIKRGDLNEIPGGAVVGIIDGVFGETLAISPGEIRDAIGRGVSVFGASSMGALRAAEIPKVKGVGRIYEMYKTGSIERDDEVALLFAADSYTPLTVPLVNIRYAVERLVRTGTLNRDDGNSLIEACEKLHFRDRTYQAIFENSKLAQNKDRNEIIHLLKNFDLKREDAQFLLETIANLGHTFAGETTFVPVENEENGATFVSANHYESADAPVSIWESGDTVSLEELIAFLKITGAFETYARNVISRRALSGTPLRLFNQAASTGGSADSHTDAHGLNNRTDAQALLDLTRLVWGWESPEEAHLSLRDLGLGLHDVSGAINAELAAKKLIAAFALENSNTFQKNLRSELWLNDISLKRETMRLGSLRKLAAAGRRTGPASVEQITDAKRTLCRLQMAMQWSQVREDFLGIGLTEDEIDEFVNELAVARRVPVSSFTTVNHKPISSAVWQTPDLKFERSIKHAGSNRFSSSIEVSLEIAKQIAERIGIARIGMIGELDNLGIHVAQAFGERSGWSASFSSGKSETKDGAKLGSIMEEVEIFAQDACEIPVEVTTAFSHLDSLHKAMDPVDLGLPYDSRYHSDLPIEWCKAFDLIHAEEVLLPKACLKGERVTNDIYYSPRLGGKIFSTSGLGSGFSVAEATVHAACEFIERHATRLAEVQIDFFNDKCRFAFIDLDTLPEQPKRIVGKYLTSGMTVRILNITSDIAVPTFYARVFDDPFAARSSATSDGFACHPDPEVAVTMALLEAAQTKAGVIAGGREDYSLQARSLGRHERPRTMVPHAQAFWFCNDICTMPLSAVNGFKDNDILNELEFITNQVRLAGYDRFIVKNLTVPQISPAFAVRTLIPAAETTNPLYTGIKAREVIIQDLLPPRKQMRWM